MELTAEFWALVEKTPTCWLWKGWQGDGRGIFQVDGKKVLAHRLSFMTYNYNIPSTAKVRHTCANGLCVRPDHLYVETEGDRFWRRVEKTATCWLWSGTQDKRGYGVFAVKGNRQEFAHHAVFRLLRGEHFPKGTVLMHTCDTPICVNPDHLVVGTREANIADRNRKGRTARGESSGRSKLTTSAVREIRGRYADGEPQEKIACDYGVTQENVSAIIRGKTWKEA